MSGRVSAKARAKPATPRLIAAASASGVSLPVQVAMRSEMAKPSASMASAVRPNAGSRCMPQTISRNARSGDCVTAVSVDFNRPYSAREPVTTAMERAAPRRLPSDGIIAHQIGAARNIDQPRGALARPGEAGARHRRAAVHRQIGQKPPARPRLQAALVGLRQHGVAQLGVLEQKAVEPKIAPGALLLAQ